MRKTHCILALLAMPFVLADACGGDDTTTSGTTGTTATGTTTTGSTSATSTTSSGTAGSASTTTGHGGSAGSGGASGKDGTGGAKGGSGGSGGAGGSGGSGGFVGATGGRGSGGMGGTAGRGGSAGAAGNGGNASARDGGGDSGDACTGAFDWGGTCDCDGGQKGVQLRGPASVDGGGPCACPRGSDASVSDAGGAVTCNGSGSGGNFTPGCPPVPGSVVCFFGLSDCSDGQRYIVACVAEQDGTVLCQCDISGSGGIAFHASSCDDLGFLSSDGGASPPFTRCGWNVR